MKNIALICFLMCLGFSACQNPQTASDASSDSAQDANGVVLAEDMPKQKIDTANLPIFEFETMEHDFGKIKEGEVVSFEYKFKNVGKSPLVIEDAKATCGCTKPKYPKEAVPPGGSGKISVTFDSKGKQGFMQKPVVVISNVLEANTSLFFKGEVEVIDNNMGPLNKTAN